MQAFEQPARVCMLSTASAPATYAAPAAPAASASSAASASADAPISGGVAASAAVAGRRQQRRLKHMRRGALAELARSQHPLVKE